MPGANCSVFGCTTSRYTSGIAIFNVPKGDDDYNTSWRAKLENFVTKDRVITNPFREQIKKRNLKICELHFEDSKLIRRK